MSSPTISEAEFLRFRRFIHEAAGISLSESKKALVSGRLAKRVAMHGLGSYGKYLDLLASGQAPQETQIAVDLLTTNETYFFREDRHFEALRQEAIRARQLRRPFRVWSAASSSGEEAYSIAMVLDDTLGSAPWEVVGTDISTRVLERARKGHYPEERCNLIPPAYRKRYCLRGVGEQQGTLLVMRELRQRVQFLHANLNEPLPSFGQFDVVFLRNVLIYFSPETKRQVVGRVLAPLVRGGLFFVGHSESLNDVTDSLEQLAPAIYRKP